jgi:hypothetical protein
MPSIIQEVGETFAALYKGFSVTLKTMFRKAPSGFLKHRLRLSPAIAESTYFSATKMDSKSV